MLLDVKRIVFPKICGPRVSCERLVKEKLEREISTELCDGSRAWENRLLHDR